MAEPLTFAQNMLVAVEATLLKRATDEQLDMVKSAYGERSIERNMGFLISLRDKLKAEVTQENTAAALAAGTGQPGRIQVRF